ncbi:hypothetical protein [Paenibacillus sp. NPDC057934]|uniref:hypothetical protein n=1 Tax=Paenibacillus sp. NPDC057934 TaxID=3346282 RepID=UPI0036D7E29B
MSYNRIYRIEENLRSLKVISPDDIEDAKNELLRLKSLERITEEDLKYTKIRYQSQLASPPAIANSIAITAMAISLIVGMFSVSSINKDVLTIFFSIVAVIISLSMIPMISNNKIIYKKCVTFTIMIALIDEVVS